MPRITTPPAEIAGQSTLGGKLTGTSWKSEAQELGRGLWRFSTQIGHVQGCHHQ